jgi:hypothetical protein
MIAVAVSLKTESGDDYLYLENHEDIVKTVLDCMMDEIEYVSCVMVDVYPYDYAVHDNVINKLNEARGQNV